MINNMKDKILNITKDYLEDSLGYEVVIRLFTISNGEYRAMVKEYEYEYYIYLNEDELRKSFGGYIIEEDALDVAKDLVDTILHECIHIICIEEDLEYHDGDFDFEKMLYDRYINSNFHRYPGSSSIQEQIEGEKKNLEKLSNILNISIEEMYEHLSVREDKFLEKYHRYINYILDNIEGEIENDRLK